MNVEDAERVDLREELVEQIVGQAELDARVHLHRGRAVRRVDVARARLAARDLGHEI